VAISDTHVVVGAYGDDDKGRQSGSAYVYERDGAFVAKLTATDGSQDDYFGYSVAISGTHVVVGAYGDDDKASESGSDDKGSESSGSSYYYGDDAAKSSGCAYIYVVEDLI